ncbi:MAG: AIR carboxylase family protein [Candidatus Thermoplasmatota archaeon]
MGKVVVIMGSRSDLEHCKRISKTLDKFGIEHVLRVASAHKSPIKVLDIIKEYEKEEVIFITVAGRSNALSGFVDANTTKPVIASPPYSDRFAGFDIFSSLRLPSGVSPMVVLEPESAALAGVKILSLSDKKLEEKIKREQENNRKDIEREDRNLKFYK